MAKKKSVKEVESDVMSKEELKKVKKAKKVERDNKRKELINSLPFNQIQFGKLINVIDEGNGNFVKQYGVPLKVSKEKQAMLITSVVLKGDEVVSVSTSYIPENLRVRVKDGSGIITVRKLKDKDKKGGEEDYSDEED